MPANGIATRNLDPAFLCLALLNDAMFHPRRSGRLEIIKAAFAFARSPEPSGQCGGAGWQMALSCDDNPLLHPITLQIGDSDLPSHEVDCAHLVADTYGRGDLKLQATVEATELRNHLAGNSRAWSSHRWRMCYTENALSLAIETHPP